MFFQYGIGCLRQMFPQHDEGYLKEVFNGSLDLPDAIDEVLKSEKEQGKKCILYLMKCGFCERKVNGLWKMICLFLCYSSYRYHLSYDPLMV